MLKKAAFALLGLTLSTAAATADDNPNFHTVDIDSPASDGVDRSGVPAHIANQVRSELAAIGIDEAQIRSISVETKHLKANEDSPILRRDVWVYLNGGGGLARIALDGASQIDHANSYVLTGEGWRPILAHTR